MAREVEYYQVDSRNPTTGQVHIGIGDTADEATEKCIRNIGVRP